MSMSDRKMSAVQNIMRQQRMEYKKKENAGKPPLCASDIEKTTDFIFSTPFEREGDSGKLLLAKRKTDRSDRYFVKHAFTDCACNEYVYTKLAQRKQLIHSFQNTQDCGKINLLRFRETNLLLKV